MEISAEIVKGISYQPLLQKQLKQITFGDFDVNQVPASCLVSDNQNSFAISKWRTPKRTRSYPYERVYNTLSTSKRITIVPVIIDEGINGDRDFVQWDTIALMSLLDVYVILAFASDAGKHPKLAGKITSQKLDNFHVVNKIQEISNYFSSALHWNLKELANLPQIIQQAQTAYEQISLKTGVLLHGAEGLRKFAAVVEESLEAFQKSSRQKAFEAQKREFATLQPKELLATATKAKITITNFLGGKYFFTVDEIKIENDIVELIECKHSNSSKLPSLSDIKDGFIKMMLYSNLENVAINNVSRFHRSVLQLTGKDMFGSITSENKPKEQNSFFQKNKFNARQILLSQNLFAEAQQNNFVVRIGN
jgi:hypothetical protein